MDFTADLGLGWTVRRTELLLEARNLFNHRIFNYATTTNLIDTEMRSPQRPASVVLRVRFSLLHPQIDAEMRTAGGLCKNNLVSGRW